MEQALESNLPSRKRKITENDTLERNEDVSSTKGVRFATGQKRNLIEGEESQRKRNKINNWSYFQMHVLFLIKVEYVKIKRF